MTELEESSLRSRIGSTLGGAQILTVAGSVWAIYGLLLLKELGEPWLSIGLISVALCLFIGNIYLRKKFKKLPPIVVSSGLQKSKSQAGRTFIIINILQGIAIIAAANLLFNLHLAEYISPTIALIVGLHFFALAFFMRISTHWVIGGLMCLLAVGTVTALPVFAVVKDSTAQTTILWGVIVGLGSCIILWSSAIFYLLQVRKAIST